MAEVGSSQRTEEERRIDDILADVRDNPSASKDFVVEKVEPALNEILMYAVEYDDRETRTSQQTHFFCHRAPPTIRESATFLLRLHAYEPSGTYDWLGRVWRAIRACYDCVRGHEEAKHRSLVTFLSAYPEKKREEWASKVNDWERQQLLIEYRQAGFSPHMPADGRQIQSASPHLLYHALLNIVLLQTPTSLEGAPDVQFSIAMLIKNFPPRARVDDFPPDPPPGVMLLFFHEDEALREWAEKQTFNTVVSLKDVEGFYSHALQVVADRLEGNVSYTLSLTWSTFFASSRMQLWTGLYSLLQTFSPEALHALIQVKGQDWIHFLTRHLHDNDSHFPLVLQCFVHVLNETGPAFWASDSPEFPEVVYDSIKDNPAFGRLLEAGVNVEEPWFLTCFQSLLLSVWDKPVFHSILAKVINFMSEELQHPRFEPPCRALVMQVVLSTMGFVHNAASEKDDIKRREAICSVFAIQATNIASVAFARQYRDSVWGRARSQAISLLRDVFESDVTTLERAMVDMCAIRDRVLKPAGGKPEPDVDLPPIISELNKIRHIALYGPLWEAVRKAIPMSDAQGSAFLIHSVAPSLHLGLDPEHAFHEHELIKDPALRKTFRNAVECVNAGLAAIRKDFSLTLTAFAEASSTEALLDLLKSPEVIRDMLRLILCPLEDVSLAAQDIITQASFAAERMDVFRFLLVNSPGASIDGINAYIKTFNDCAPVFPEVCSMARWMVRCLADVVEALCDPISGVLRQEGIVNNTEIPKRIFNLWRSMCRASAAIFKHTPSWARFYATGIMTDWMRDALIFVRDLVKNLQVFESAMQGSSQQKIDDASPAKITLSNIGKKSALQVHDVLQNLVGWLRLTDAETLHQSTELICELLKMYRRTHVDPPRDAVDTIERYTSGTKSQGKLTREQLSTLSDAITPFVIVEIGEGDEEDEVTFTGRAPAKVAEPVHPPRTVASRDTAVPRQQMDVFKQIQPPKVHGFKSSADRSDVFGAPLISAATIRERSAPKKSAFTQAAPAKPSTLMGQLRQDFRKDRKGIPAGLQPRKREPKNEPKNEGGPVKVTGESESSAEDESSDVETGIHQLSRLQRSPAKPLRPIASKPPPKPERRHVQLLEVSNTTSNPVLERIRNREQQARRQQRLKPDLGNFTRQVLLWNYEDEGDVPPFPPDRRPILESVPFIFNTYEEYRRIFEPLLMYECWSGIAKSKEEKVAHTVLCDIGSRSNIDDWLDLEVGVNTDSVPPNWFLTDTDVVLLKQHPGGHKSIMAKVESFRRTARGVEARFRCCLGHDTRGLNMALQIRSQWKAHKVFSFTTIYREYAALRALSLYDLCDDILRPKPARLPKFSNREIEDAMKAFEVNEPQANAILGSVQAEGFALIQGPPGTGKTKTICGLVGNWLSRRSTAIHPTRPGEKVIKAKILICAPSNAAIDEVAKRLKDGVRNSRGQRVVPNVVRVGADAVINVSVKEISLDELIERRINGDPNLKSNKTEAQADIINLRRDIDDVQSNLRMKQRELADTKDNAARVTALETEIRTLNQKRTGLTAKLNSTRDKQKDAGRTMDAARRRFRQEVLDDADVICCTLSGSGHDVLSAYDFETVVIDEAAQSVEVSSLIPLKYQCKRCILVGDPEQLPPTVLSQLAEQQGYSRSLFVRIMHRRPDAVHLLSIQYRMHPEISALDSAMFYNSKLKDGPGMAEKTAQPWHTNPLFGPYRFFDVAGQEMKAGFGHSLVNDEEARSIADLYKRIRAEFPAVNFDYRIGIVTMYREQMFRLRRVFRDRFGEHALTAVDFNTVDGFQGQEKDIIILSCVRAGPNQSSVGFLADRRRSNVAITRARSSLFIFGNAPTLERSDAVWKHIVQDARTRQLIMKVDSSTFRVHAAPPVAPAKKMPTPRKSKAEAPKAPPPDLMTPQEIARAKQNARKISDAAVNSQPQPEATGSGTSNPSLKRKASNEGPMRPPPALRAADQIQRSEVAEVPIGPNSRTENNGTPKPVSPAKRKNGTDGPQRPAPNMRSPNKHDKNGRHRQHYGGSSSNSSVRGPATTFRSRPIPLPTLGNPIAVPSNDPPPPPRINSSSGPSRPPQRLPVRGDGTTSQTMFIPKKRPNNPNNPPQGPSNAKQRLMQEARPPPR
ncbi:hypothetical protein CALCODRAFT_465756 [Calocera cornea HHB12733]|uniref:Helicase ATP-binding domain-containing protein n=1 Tax=Calocera cornea HHB12733 TaxID=1353952 RepID=A0A165IA33_9BASI|nr:hypothetical protein CALCODRAFT_465756 [Calocera cornea HHB12733]